MRDPGRRDGPADAVLVLITLGAPERRRLRGRRGQAVEEAAPEPVPTSRVTAVLPEPFASRAQAEAWLAGLRDDRELADDEIRRALALVNRAVHAHRVARADPYAREVSRERALVTRVGFGGGAAVAEGRFAAAWELPPEVPRRRRRSMETPDERFAAILSGRTQPLACEELVLRARADLNGGRSREAALEARVALEALLAELPSRPGDEQERPGEADRTDVARAANAALDGPLDAALAERLEGAVARMEAALRRHRLG